MSDYDLISKIISPLSKQQQEFVYVTAKETGNSRPPTGDVENKRVYTPPPMSSKDVLKHSSSFCGRVKKSGGTRCPHVFLGCV